MKLDSKYVLALGYHDVTEDWRLSGTPLSLSAAVYTLDRSRFTQHLVQIDKKPVLLTFDDGRESNYTIVAPELEQSGRRGYFFITTDWIGTPGFLSAGQIQELAGRGHVIGSHSCSHPERMSKLDHSQLLNQWSRSRAVLEDILGASVTTASVPGGYYSTRVARTAAEAGYTVLFTSEPRSRVHRVAQCRVIGRYSIKRHSPAALAGAIASGKLLPRFRQALEWNAKKPVKFLAGDLYLTARQMLLRSRCPNISSF